MSKRDKDPYEINGQYEDLYKQVASGISEYVDNTHEFPTEYFQHDNPMVRSIAAALYHWESEKLSPADRDYTAPLLPLLNDPYEHTRRNAMLGVVKLDFKYHFDDKEKLEKEIALVAKIQEEKPYFLELLYNEYDEFHHRKLHPGFLKYAEEGLDTKNSLQIQTAAAKLYGAYLRHKMIKKPLSTVRDLVMTHPDQFVQIILMAPLSDIEYHRFFKMFSKITNNDNIAIVLAITCRIYQENIRNHQDVKEYVFRILTRDDLTPYTKSWAAYVVGHAFSSLEPLYWKSLIKTLGQKDPELKFLERDMEQLIENAAGILYHKEDYADVIPELQQTLNSLLEDEDEEIRAGMAICKQRIVELIQKYNHINEERKK